MFKSISGYAWTHYSLCTQWRLGRQSRTGGPTSLGIFDSGCRLQLEMCKLKDGRLLEPSASKGDFMIQTNSDDLPQFTPVGVSITMLPNPKIQSELATVA